MISLKFAILLSLLWIVHANILCQLESGLCTNWKGEHVAKIPPVPTPKAPNFHISSFVKNLASSLSLRAKIGQMTQLDVSMLLNATDLAEGIVTLNRSALYYGVHYYGVGSYLNSPYSFSAIGNKSGLTPPEWVDFVSEIKQLALSYSNYSLPIIYGLDSVHGANYVYGATLFPQNLGVAATFDRSLAAEGPGRIAAKDTRLCGVSWMFSPVLGIGVNPLWPRIYETFGEDPYVAAQMGSAVIKAIEGDDLDSQEHCTSCTKHFFGYSDPKSGKDRTAAWIGQRQLLKYFLPPFQAAFNAGSHTTMINSGIVNGIPVHSSREMLTDILRDQIGFTGVSVTDYQDIEKLVTVHHLVETFKEATALAIEAGIDMSMVPLDYSFCDDLYELVQEGIISESRIDLSVQRILQLKYDLGLFGENYLPDPSNPELESIGSEDDWEVALNLARESITLLKNENSLLPLPKNLKKILVTGPAGNSISVQSGGWSIHWQGGAEDEFTYGTTIYGGIRAAVGNNTQVVFNQGVSFSELIDIQSVIHDAQGADVIILCLGEAPEAEIPGNINDLTLSTPQLALYLALEKLDIPIVLALVEARPRVLDVASDASAIFMCYLPGPIGGRAFADLLFGDYSPSGRLPITYPSHTGDVGVSYYHLYSDETYPLYEFGFGLSYTTFAYSNLSVSSTNWNITSQPSLNVSVSVQNTGNFASDLVVLLFVSDVFCTVSPEVKMLKRFERVNLAPEQYVQLSWSLEVTDLTFISRALQLSVETGLFLIQVGDQAVQFSLQI